MSVNEWILTIDGPSGSGKGTVAQLVARKLGWHYLDSGALYRVLGVLALRKKMDLEDESSLADVARNLELSFQSGDVFLGSERISEEIRTEQTGNLASKIATMHPVREALLQWQRDCAKAPGLVADGRDMGTVVFPRAKYKIFLTASVSARAQRRFKQLRDKGFGVNIRRLLHEIAERDERDMNRVISPLRAADDAICLDSTNMGIDEVVSSVMNLVRFE
ncbi:MAG: (d)CMP kinase [Gammaproteobacteria bacterium]|nr:(d)CMP kinase [Gammaproteobacteria bacterium]